jgi:Fe-S-cluster containining protein
LAGFIGLSIDEFERRFVRRVGSRLSLKERANGDCVFYRPDAGCSVYEHRPRQCRSWPFWESNLRSRAAWRETCRNCPGAGAGRLYTLDEILTEAARICV